jgi:hypothetical protein
MMISRVLLWILLAFFIYKFVFDFLAPLIKVMLKMRRQVKNFQQQQGPFQQQQTANGSTNHAEPKNNAASNGSKVGEYIDFEEVKD